MITRISASLRRQPPALLTFIGLASIGVLALCRAVLSAVQAFQAGTPQLDDMTVVAVRVL